MENRKTRLETVQEWGTTAWYLAIAKVLASRRDLAVTWVLVALVLVVTCGFGWQIVAWTAPPAFVAIGVLMSTQRQDARRMDGRLRDELATVDRPKGHAPPTDRPPPSAVDRPRARAPRSH